MRFEDPGRCPRCGERVTPYAAGCAICGAALDPKRWQAPPPRLARLIGRGKLALARRRPA